jgi:hypothetical protein
MTTSSENIIWGIDHMKSIIVLFIILLSGTTFADEVSDQALQRSVQFLDMKPYKEHWKMTNEELIDAWERIDGLSTLLFLKYNGGLPLKMEQELRKHVISLRAFPTFSGQEEYAKQLSAMVSLYSTYADYFLNGDIDYKYFSPIATYVKNGKYFAEKLRGKPYLKCDLFSDQPCLAPWQQH